MIRGEWKSDGLDRDGNATYLVEQYSTSPVTTVNPSSSNDESVAQWMIDMDVKGGSPMNLLCSFSSPVTKFFYQVEILDTISNSASISVGVVRPSELKQGWGTKGMFYNGNLTNGSAALKVGYGPYLKKEDTIIVEYTEDDNNYQVHFHVNGTCLGIAFEIAKESSTSESFYPCLHVQGGIKVRTSVSLQPPVPSIHVSKNVHVLEDDWTLVHSFEAPEGMAPIWPISCSEEDVREQTITLHMEPLSNDENTDRWILAVKVYNSLRVVKIISPSSDVGNDTTTTMEYRLVPLPGAPSDGVMSTMMRPPPPFVEIERKLSRALASDWQILRVSDSNILHVLSNNGTILAKLHRQERNQDGVACTSYRY